jgi:hypothetical protein
VSNESVVDGWCLVLLTCDLCHKDMGTLLVLIHQDKTEKVRTEATVCSCCRAAMPEDYKYRSLMALIP